MEWRLYERATKGGGAVIKSTGAGGSSVISSSAGGGTTLSSTAGGGVSKSTSSGGNSTQTSSNMAGFSLVGFQTGEDLNRGNYHVHAVTLDGNDFEHRHTVSVPAHSHSFQTPDHQHNVVLKDHQHTITIQDHQHSINLPDHKHDLEYGIFEYDKLPTKLTIKVDGKVIPITALEGENIELIPHLAKDSDDKVIRGWHTLEISPNDLARISAIITTQFFIQSRGGGQY